MLGSFKKGWPSSVPSLSVLGFWVGRQQVPSCRALLHLCAVLSLPVHTLIQRLPWTMASILEKDGMVNEKKDSITGSDGSLTGDIGHAEPNKEESVLDYPEGGLRSWLVVSGAAAVMFCTFGYLTGFGCVCPLALSAVHDLEKKNYESIIIVLTKETQNLPAVVQYTPAGGVHDVRHFLDWICPDLPQLCWRSHWGSCT